MVGAGWGSSQLAGLGMGMLCRHPTRVHASPPLAAIHPHLPAASTILPPSQAQKGQCSAPFMRQIDQATKSVIQYCAGKLLILHRSCCCALAASLFLPGALEMPHTAAVTASKPLSLLPSALCADACPCKVDPAGPNALSSRSAAGSNSTTNTTSVTGGASGTVAAIAGTPEVAEEPRVRAFDGGVTAGTASATEAALKAGRSAAQPASYVWQSPSGCCVRPPVSRAFGPSDEDL